MAAPIEVDRRCRFYVDRKKRFCKLIPGVGKHYCGEHISFSSDVNEAGERKRIPCPVDQKHTIYEDQLQKHLKKCNSKLKQNHVYYKKNINAGSDDDSLDQSKPVSISSMDLDQLKSIISKVKKSYNDTKIDLRDEVLDHEVFHEELDNPMNGASARKHLLQQASLLGHLQQKRLLSNNTCFIEFGAGRGQLSHWLQKALPDSTDVKVILVDRGHNRRKLDCYHRNQGPKFERLNLDISDLVLASVPGVGDNGQPIVGVSKHLCGAATDLALRCLMQFEAHSSGNPHVVVGRLAGDEPQPKHLCAASGNLPVDEPHVEGGRLAVDEPQPKRLCTAEDPQDKRAVSGVVFALCCHHRCNWKNYVGKKFFKDSNFSPEEFAVISRLTSWAVCGTRKTDHTENEPESHDQINPTAPESMNIDSQSDSTQQVIINRSDGLSADERAEIGRQCKRLIDLGRVKYMQDRGFNIDLVHYVQREVSLENLVFIATPKRAPVADT